MPPAYQVKTARPRGYYHRPTESMSACDPLFEACLEASESAAPAALERLAAAALPVIREASGAALGFDHPDLEDVCADALVRIVNRVQQLRERPDGSGGILNVAAYAAVTARRVCADYLRRAHPVRARLGSRVRYALTHDPALRLRVIGGEIRHAGLAGWSDGLGAAPRQELAQIARSIRVDAGGAALLNTLRALLERTGRWVELGTLVSVLFDAAALRDPTFTSVEEVEPAAPAMDGPSDAQESRSRLEAAWREIVTLPPRQRVALLLHMRDDEGRSGLPMFALTGVADLAGLAAALEVQPGQLAELWPSLPLDDLAIARRLGATRQQVINLRKSARARLGRRLARQAPGVVIPGAFGRQVLREHS
jgi:RNA polymerase sigma factor (sigma-70 family)